MIFIVFSMNCWPKTIPKRSDNPADHFEPVSASPGPSRPNLHRIFIPKKNPKKYAKKTFRKTTCKSLKIQLSCVFEGLGPLPNCRSHFSDQDGIDESSRNPQNTSFMTKQCSEKNDDREFSRITRVSDNQGFPSHRDNGREMLGIFVFFLFFPVQ